MFIRENNLNYLLAKMWIVSWVQICLLLQLQEKQMNHVEDNRSVTIPLSLNHRSNVEIFGEINMTENDDWPHTNPWIWWRGQD